MTAPDGYPGHPEKVLGEDAPYGDNPGLAAYGEELTKPLVVKWLRFRLDAYSAGFVGRHPIATCLGLVGLATVGGIFIESSRPAPVPRDIVSEARLLTLKNAPALKALGLCRSELLAEAGLERYRAGRGRGSIVGLTSNVYENAASLAQQYGVSCNPANNPASYNMHVPGGQTVTVHPRQITSIDADQVCDIQKHPGTELAPPDRGDAEHYAQLIQRAATNIIAAENIRC